MEELTVGPWRRPGKDRLYVNRPGAKGESVAWLDCQTGMVTITNWEYEAAALAKIEDWCRTCGRPIPPRIVKPNASTTRQPVRPPRPPSQSPPRPAALPVLPPLTSDDDLARNRPGAGLQSMIRADEQRHKWLVRVAAKLVGDSLGGEQRLKGLQGEEIVGGLLESLKPAGWEVLHGIPLPTGSDIDHVAIGPPGVFTVNAKHHPDASVWVGDGAVKINRSSHPYLQNSEFEADRTARLLSQWCGFDVPVHPVIAVVGARKITYGATAHRVDVLDAVLIATTLSARPALLSPTRQEQIYRVARHRYVWSQIGKRGARSR
ncbi:nuclease-related domain-containing protein [Kitasatospora herbaricolor]|uniref:nuclease-related domain-containing protein n=1 Tax=Kitasatospora herbaricolor TaxID=68217 RepID=UPI0036D842D3